MHPFNQLFGTKCYFVKFMVQMDLNDDLSQNNQLWKTEYVHDL